MSYGRLGLDEGGLIHSIIQDYVLTLLNIAMFCKQLSALKVLPYHLWIKEETSLPIIERRKKDANCHVNVISNIVVE
jgi:hypothetical protein